MCLNQLLVPKKNLPGFSVAKKRWGRGPYFRTLGNAHNDIAFMHISTHDHHVENHKENKVHPFAFYCHRIIATWALIGVSSRRTQSSCFIWRSCSQKKSEKKSCSGLFHNWMFVSDNFDFSRRMLINFKTPFRNSRFKTNNSKIFFSLFVLNIFATFRPGVICISGYSSRLSILHLF